MRDIPKKQEERKKRERVGETEERGKEREEDTSENKRP